MLIKHAKQKNWFLKQKEVLLKQGLLEIHIVFTSQPRYLDPIPYSDLDTEQDAD